jgi:hypothetical protein
LCTGNLCLCQQNGAACNENTDCCNNACIALTGICDPAQSATCGEGGMDCFSDVECAGACPSMPVCDPGSAWCTTAP